MRACKKSWAQDRDPVGAPPATISAASAQGGDMRTKPCLTSVDAHKMMAACKAEAERNKWQVSVAIVDDAGFLLLLERMEGAGPTTPEVAHGKARTAALTKQPTRLWEERVKERPAFLNYPAGLSIWGGVPIIYGNECVGAIGVSGVQSQDDEKIAIAGTAALG
jgi:glc operon protein GlcG